MPGMLLCLGCLSCTLMTSLPPAKMSAQILQLHSNLSCSKGALLRLHLLVLMHRLPVASWLVHMAGCWCVRSRLHWKAVHFETLPLRWSSVVRGEMPRFTGLSVALAAAR